ncbi:ribonuclease E/G [Bacillus methanolicus]|uniref:Rne/Rng family ribonuclease n=1 Tax=Bacillus methanolicus TaxID=1471 RepID=UPI00200D43BC|nr:Rne/Rng family ribonuclease [Bacillus methanolicus]UQD52890.1 ribonuclease E/G [Bacillus methanolicus]
MKLIVNSLTREKRFALLNGQTVEKFFIEQPRSHSIVGNLYLGVVSKVLPGMNAAFVDIGEEKSGYLHRDKLPAFVLSDEPKEVRNNRSISSFVHQGEKILVQVEKDATGTKGPRLTGIIELQGEYMIYMPNGRYIAVSKKIVDERNRERWRRFGKQIKAENEGLIFRTSAENQTEDVIASELEALRNMYKELERIAASRKKPSLLFEKDLFYKQLISEIKTIGTGEVIVDDILLKDKIERYVKDAKINVNVALYTGKENIFNAWGIEHQIEKALKRIVWLDNGAYLIFDEAEALTVIDVNTGKYSGKNDLQDTVVSVNLAAAEEAARQIRVRDIGGIILIDFIDMNREEDRERVLQKMQSELTKDDRRTKVIGFTPLGILQLTRKKTKVAISEALTAKCVVCEGTGRVLSPETVAFRLERELWEQRHSDYDGVLIETTKEVADVFAGENNIHQIRLEEMLGLKIKFEIKEDSPKPYYHIRRFERLTH